MWTVGVGGPYCRLPIKLHSFSESTNGLEATRVRNPREVLVNNAPEDNERDHRLLLVITQDPRNWRLLLLRTSVTSLHFRLLLIVVVCRYRVFSNLRLLYRSEVVLASDQNVVEGLSLEHVDQADVGIGLGGSRLLKTSQVEQLADDIKWILEYSQHVELVPQTSLHYVDLSLVVHKIASNNQVGEFARL